MNTSPRLPFLDGLRLAAFALLIPYHVGMYYVSWDWHVKSPVAVPGLEPFMLLTAPWRLGLLFLVAGAASHGLLARRGAWAYARQRTQRLLLPLLFGMVVVVVPQAYLEVLTKAPQLLPGTGGYLDFWWAYLQGGRYCWNGNGCIAVPTWNHLWFLAYLWPYSLLALGAWAAEIQVRAGASCGAKLGAGEALDGHQQRAGNDGWPRKSPRPFGLTRQKGPYVVAPLARAASPGCALRLVLLLLPGQREPGFLPSTLLVLHRARLPTLGGWPAWAWCLLPAVPLVLARLVVMPHSPSTHNFVHDAYNHCQYAYLFGLGWLSRTPVAQGLWPASLRWRWPLLVAALVSWALLVAYFQTWAKAEPPALLRQAQRVLWALMAWWSMAAACGWAQRWFTTDRAWLRRGSAMVLCAYVLHQSLIVVLAYALRPWALPWGLEALLLIALTAALCVGLYAVLRHIPGVRACVGIVPPGQARVA